MGQTRWAERSRDLEERQCDLVRREGMAGGERERERRTCNQCCVASRGQRMAGMPPEVWRGGMSTLRRVSGSNESRAAVRRAVVARWLARRRSGRRAMRARAYAQGGQDGGPRGRGLMLGHTNAPPQSFKASSSLPRPHKDDEGMVGSARRRELKPTLSMHKVSKSHCFLPHVFDVTRAA